MIIMEILSILIVLYLIAGAFTGFIISGEIDKDVQTFKKQGKDPKFIRGFILASYTFALIHGPYNYALAFLGLKR